MSKSSLFGLFKLEKCVGVGKAIVAATATIAGLTACITIQTPPVATSPSPVPSVALSPSLATVTPTPVAATTPAPNPVAPPVTISAPAAPAGVLVLGTASTGQTISLDTRSIPFSDGAYAQATYYLGDERLEATVHCGLSYWTVKGDDSTRYTPQSQATQNLVTLACQSRFIKENERMNYFIVYDPTSNVRSTPNGAVKCVIENMEIIQVVNEPRGTWHNTTKCGGGWIDESQIRPLR